MIFDELTKDEATEESDASNNFEDNNDRLPQLRSYREHEVRLICIYTHNSAYYYYYLTETSSTVHYRLYNYLHEK